MGALVRQESNGRHTLEDGSLLTSSAGAKGITQIMPDTGRNPGFGVTPLQNDSEQEYLRFGRDYLAALIDYYDGSVPLALAAYNAGSGNVDEAVKAAREAGDAANFLDYLPTSPENQRQTRTYVANIMAMLERSTETASDDRPISAPNARASVPAAVPVNVPDARAEVPEARQVNAPDARAELLPMRTGGTMTSRRTGGRF